MLGWVQTLRIREINAMPKKTAKTFERYEVLRNELAQVSLAFAQEGTAYPGIKLAFLEGETKIPWTQWEDWISKHRHHDAEMESWDVFPLDWKSRGTGANGLPKGEQTSWSKSWVKGRNVPLQVQTELAA